MSLNLFLSHTGRRYTVATEQIPSPEALKQWISSEVNVPTGRQILMTGQGKNVKQQHLVNDSNIFIYDKRFLAGDGALVEGDGDNKDDEDTSYPPETREIPSELEDETSLASWQRLFKARRAWALDALDMVKTLSGHNAHLAESCVNIDRSTNVALDNLKNHVNTLQSLFDKTQVWAQDTLQEHADMLREWSAMTTTLKELPIRDEIGRLMNTAAADHDQTSVAGTMYVLLDHKSLDHAEETLKTSSDTFHTQLDDVAGAMDQLRGDSDQASRLVQIEWPNMDAGSLLEEAETLFKKVDGDYNDVLRSAADTKAVSKISRVAANHTNSLLPGLQEVVTESVQIFTTSREHKKLLSGICFKVLHKISDVQGKLARLQQQVSSLALSEDGQHALESLDRVFRLPSAYGNILIEAIRRSEWNGHTVTDLKTLKDDLLQHKDDELRRRKKWANSMSGFLSHDIASASTTTNPDSIPDFTFSTPSNPWPFVSREEIFAYIDDLRALEIDDAAEIVTQSLRDLDAPAKSRRPRPKAFDNGSIHGSMQNSFLRNGADDGDNLKTLQDDKTRLEDKVRASESRIRRLEDLLHKSQMQTTSVSSTGRTQSGNSMFNPITDFSQQATPASPGPDSSSRHHSFEPSSRRSSVSHARRLSNQTSDERAMVQRIALLETENGRLKQEAHTERRSSDQHREKMQEAESVKRDLLANFDSQRQEFDDERQRLEDDNHELKIRLEELEEELDRVVGSRDHERTKQESSINHYRSELERLRKTSNDEIERLTQIKDHLEREVDAQRNKHAHADQQLHKLREDRSSLQTRNMGFANDLRALESRSVEILATLQAAHEHLSPSGSAPDDVKRLADALEVLAEGATFHARGLDDQLSLAFAQGRSQGEKIESLERQVAQAESTKQEQESKSRDQDEQHRQDHHALETLRAELEDEKAQGEKLRAKFAAGETGSEALKARLVDEEKRLEELAAARDKSEVQVEILQTKIVTLRGEIATMKEARESVRARLEGREKKARDLSERLFQHHDRMVRMLENFGYSISKDTDGNGLIIQRASKVNASQILGGTIADLGTPMKRQISGTIAIQHFSDPDDTQTLYWTSDDPEAEDTRYNTFLSALARLDLDSTIELVTKRYKDVEGLARKYQKDTRLLREKSHRLQSEAHEKIAYRAFKEGDVALFLPTRNQATRPWAAFNIGAPHYFLREQDSHRLASREWLLARINKVEERVVDLSRSMGNASMKANAELGEGDGASLQSIDDNPFELSDGLRWYMIDAVEEKPGAPSTPGLGKSTVAASVIDVKGQNSMGGLGRKISGKDDKDKRSPVDAAKTLHKSLDSRRSSEASRGSANRPAQLRRTNSKEVAPTPSIMGAEGEASETTAHHVSDRVMPSIKPSESSLREQGQAREDARVFDVKRRPSMNRTASARSSPSKPSASGTGTGTGTGTGVESPSKQKHQQAQAKGWDKLFSVQWSS